MARYMAHSDAMNFTEDQLNVRSINARTNQIELQRQPKVNMLVAQINGQNLF